MFVQGLHQLSRFISVQHDTIGVTSADVGSFIENDLFPLCGGVRFSPTLRESLLTMFFQQNNGISIKVYTLDNKNEKKGGRRGVKKEEEKGPPSPTVPLDGYVGRHSNVLRVAVSPEDKLYRPAEVHYPAPVTDKSVPLQTGKLIELLQKGAVCWSYKDWYNHENSKEKNRNSVLLQICPTLSLIGTSFSLTASDRYLNAFRLLSMTALCGFSNLIYNKDDVEKLSSMRALATPAYKLLHRSFMIERYHICQADAVQADSMAKQLIFPFFALPITSNVPPSDRALVDPVRRYYQRKREALPELKDAIYFSETSVNDVIRRSPGAKMLYMDAVHAILTAHGTDAEHIQFSHRWITVSDQHTIRKTAFHRMLLLSDLCVETILLQTASGKSKRTQLVFLNEDYSAVMTGLAEACEIVKKEETTKIKVESDNSQDEEDEEGEEDEDDPNVIHYPAHGKVRLFAFSPHLSLEGQLLEEALHRPLSSVLMVPTQAGGANRRLMQRLIKLQQQHPDRLLLRAEYQGTNPNHIIGPKQAPPTHDEEHISSWAEENSVYEPFLEKLGPIPKGISPGSIVKVLKSMMDSPYQSISLFYRGVDRAALHRVINLLRAAGIVVTNGCSLSNNKRVGIVTLSGTILTEEQKRAVVAADQSVVRGNQIGKERLGATAPSNLPNIALDHLPEVLQELSYATYEATEQATKAELQTDRLLRLRNGYAENGDARACRLHVELWSQLWKRNEKADQRENENAFTLEVQEVLENLSLSSFCIICGFTAEDLEVFFREEDNGKVRSFTIPWGTPVKQLQPSIRDSCLLRDPLQLSYHHALKNLHTRGVARLIGGKEEANEGGRPQRYTHVELSPWVETEEGRIEHFCREGDPLPTVLTVILAYWAPALLKERRNKLTQLDLADARRGKLASLAEQGIYPTVGEMVLLGRVLRVGPSVVAVESYQRFGLAMSAAAQRQHRRQKIMQTAPRRRRPTLKKNGSQKTVQMTTRYVNAALLNYLLTRVCASEETAEEAREVLQCVISLLENSARRLFERHPLLCEGRVNKPLRDEVLGQAAGWNRFYRRQYDFITQLDLLQTVRDRVTEVHLWRPYLMAIFSPDLSWNSDGEEEGGRKREREAIKEEEEAQEAPPATQPERDPLWENKLRLVMNYTRMVLLSDKAHLLSNEETEIGVRTFPAALRSDAFTSLTSGSAFSCSGDRFTQFSLHGLNARFLPTFCLAFNTPFTTANTCLLHNVVNLSVQLSSVNADMAIPPEQSDVLSALMQEDVQCQAGKKTTATAPAVNPLPAAIAEEPQVKIHTLLARKELGTLYMPTIRWTPDAVEAERAGQGTRRGAGRGKRRRRDDDSEEDELEEHDSKPSDPTHYPARYLIKRGMMRDFRHIPYDAPVKDAPDRHAQLLQSFKEGILPAPYNTPLTYVNCRLAEGGLNAKSELVVPYPSIFRHHDGTFHQYVWCCVVDDVYRYLARVPGITLEEVEQRCCQTRLLGPDDLRCVLRYLLLVGAVEERCTPCDGAADVKGILAGDGPFAKRRKHDKTVNFISHYRAVVWQNGLFDVLKYYGVTLGME